MNKLCKTLLIVLVLSLLLLGGCAEDHADDLHTQPENSASQGEENSTNPNTEPDRSVSPEEEPSAPQVSFEGTDISGNTVSSDIFSQSKLTMINVWATYCNPCLSEMPDLAELASEYDAGDFQLIGIISDVMEGDDQSFAESLIQETGADYTHLLLNESIYYSLLTDVSAVPTTFFLDESGTVLGAVVGAREKTAWEEIVNELLEQM